MADTQDKRNAWAEDRTILANERTFAAWMRSGMACIALAIGLKALFGSTEPTWMAKVVAEFFVLIAILVTANATLRCHKAQKRIEGHDTKAQTGKGMLLTGGSIMVGALATGVLLWIL